MVKANPAIPTSGGIVSKVAWIALDNIGVPEYPTSLKGQALANGKSIVQADSFFTIGTGTAATGNVDMTGLPADTDTIILDDGVNPAVTYEFDSDASVTDTATLQGVLIGASAAATIATLIALVNTPTAGCVIDITASAGTGDSMDLVNDAAWAIGNVAITDNADNTTVTGMSGGADSAVIATSYFQPVSFSVTSADVAANAANFGLLKHDGVTSYPGFTWNFQTASIPFRTAFPGVTLNEGLAVLATGSGARGILSYRVYGADI